MPLARMPENPLIFFTDRPSDSPYIERVWRSRSERGGVFHSIAACHWEMVVSRVAGQSYFTVRGPETAVSLADLPAHGEWFAIRFRLGTYMPALRPGQLRNCNAVTLPDATSRSFWLNGSAWEYPTFENAEVFVHRLVRAGLIGVDPWIRRALDHEPTPGSVRTLERRFWHATGLTRGAVHQIDRAREATLRLRQGASIMEVAHTAGYYDQAHLIRSLRRFIGQTPTEIAQGRRQLSFLYNTGTGAE